jgi:hypothetical protein
MKSEWGCPNCGRSGEVHHEDDSLPSAIFGLAKQAHLKVSPTCPNKHPTLITFAPTFNPLHSIRELHGNGHKDRFEGLPGQ